MERSTPWVIALACALVGGALWFYRGQRGSADTGRDARAIVQKAWGDEGRVALEGRQVIRVPGSPAIEARVVTSGDGAVRIEYLTAPLKGVTIWERAETTYRYNPRQKRLTVAQTRHSAADRKNQKLQLLQNYQPRFAGKGVVAGRETVIVELRPASGSERWKRVWIDPETSVVLASEDRSGPEKLLRSTTYVDVKYLRSGEEPPAATFAPPEELVRRYAAARPGDTSDRFTPATLSGLVGFKVREPKWIPKGYTLEGSYPTPCLCRERHQAARLEYTDGLDTITLFQCAHPDCVARDNCFAAEADARSPQAVQLKEDGVSYLAVGDAPREDLDRMTRSAAN